MADVRIPPRPIVRNEHEFKNLSAQQQASAIHEWQKLWMGTFAPSAEGVSGVNFAPLVLEAPTVPFDGAEDPGIGRRQMQEAADSELREARRIENQGL